MGILLPECTAKNSYNEALSQRLFLDAVVEKED